MYVVDLKNVLKRFHDGTQMKVLYDNMNFHVSEGELAVITGRKESGKSTLLNMIAAMTPPNKGKVNVLGQDLLQIKERHEWRLKNIGFITDEGCLIPYLTVKQNLLLGIPTDDRNFMKKEQEAENILVELGFTEESMNESLEGLSSKEQILATVARVFMTNPRLILADEPTKELTGKEGKEVLQRLLDFARKQKSTVVVVSDDESIISQADTYFILEECQLLEKNKAI
ncbi:MULTISPECIES: ATP-binding cassette domain-containing protein [Bacillaceae]|uniref:ATP-binding cassette domain-containing protein n=1 Tax=Evansella alkalicola TaxID=745819 RepID=A0ABS6JQY9_9BACI|nr:MULTISPECIES: ATP-binding cassette domain-containing protein [Bacillaceae]MBU9720526.1 ATP-binding cassette domain-containing protein [Bacillus alkalicola]